MASANTPPTLTSDLPPTGMPTKFGTTIRNWINAGVQVLWLYSDCDEARIEQALWEYGRNPRIDDDVISELPLFTWDIANGCRTFQRADERWDDTTKDPEAILNRIAKFGSEIDEDGEIINRGLEGLFLLRDFGGALNAASNTKLRRQLIEYVKTNIFNNPSRIAPIVIIASTPVPHAEIKEYVTVIDVPWPNTDVMRSAVVDYCIACAEETTGGNVPIDTKERERLSDALLGLSVEEARKVFGYSLGGRTAEDRLNMISDEKAAAIRKIEGLTYVPHRRIPHADEFGAYENYLAFLADKRFAYLPAARRLGVDRPRGVVIIGPPGTGKTQIAQATAAVLGVDLVILDINQMFQGIVGASEARIRMALAAITAMRNVAVLIDEIDKSLANAHKSQASDSGVAARMVSSLLTWLSNRAEADDNANMTFPILTMNRVDGIPPELIRTGRFDRTFSTDLPNDAQRLQILEIHLRKRGIDPAVYGNALRSVVTAAADFVGSELEQIVIDARATALARACRASDNPNNLRPEDILPTIEDLLQSATSLPPIARFDVEEIQRVQEFCRNRTTSVSAPPVQEAVRATRSRGIRANGNGSNN